METKTLPSFWPRVDLAVNIVFILRLIVAFSLLLITHYASRGSYQQLIILTSILLTYLGYSAVIYFGTFFHSNVLRSAGRHAVWMDVCWFAVLVLLTRGALPILLGGFFLTTIIAFSELARGVRLIAALLTSAIIFIDSYFDLGSVSYSLAIRIESLFAIVFGFFLMIIAILSAIREADRSLERRRLILLSEAGELANPRFGVERTLSSVLEKLRAFYKAEECLLISREDGEVCYLRRARQNEGAVAQAEAISDEFAQQLLIVRETHAFVLLPARNALARNSYFEVDVQDEYRRVNTSLTSALKSLPEIFESKSILSIPLFGNTKLNGRLFLTSQRRNAFSVNDLAFISHFISKILPVLDNLQVIDTLAMSARERERHRIARDIHDSVVQPYVGIQLGLGAIQEKVKAGLEITDDLERLLEMTHLEISGLRNFVAALSSEIKHHAQFLPAVRRLAEKFAATTGIAVEVKCRNDSGLNDKLAGEAFQMIAEGLSNIRRHTKASQAVIEIDCDVKTFHVHIADNGSKQGPDKLEFVPKSITSRTVSLGGEVTIDRTNDGGTVVSIRIPL